MTTGLHSFMNLPDCTLKFLENGASVPSSVRPKETHSVLQAPVVFGLPPVDLSGRDQLLYICDHSAFIEAFKCSIIRNVTHVGLALPYLYAGNGFRYVWNLQKTDGVFSLSKDNIHPRKKVWYVHFLQFHCFYVI